ncbi:MAG: hypothetical protein JXD23_12190 [Spirochaetales bacterium]|nr:hypothetical protein [Spirochaetales bacterium]
MKKIIALGIVLCFAGTAAFGQLEVNRGELEKGKDVEFVNYTGPYEVVRTFEEIRQRGVFLGADYTKASRRTTWENRYSVIHVYDPDDTSGKFDADIFVIEPGGFVDHIRTVRIILAGYLQTAYGYTLDDALLLARFITLYNAVFRGDIDYFKTVYKARVTANVTAANAGIALVYTTWPGRTRMLIPLSEGFEKGKTTSLDTQKLTEEKVKEALRKEENKGIEDRKKIVELQEKQIEQKETDLATDKKNLEEAKKILEEEKKALEEEKKRTGETDATRRKEAEIKQKEEEIKKTEADIAKREEALKKSETQLATDRQEIANEERKLSETVSAVDTVSADRGLFLRVQPGSENESGEVVLYNFRSTKVDARSQGLKVKERKIYIYANTPLVVAEAAGKPGAFLMLLDDKTLAVAKQSEEEIFKNSKVEIQGNAIFAVVKQGGRYVLGRFDASLTLTNKTEVEVNPFTPVTVYGPYCYVQASSGLILRLNINDLSAKDTADPR